MVNLFEKGQRDVFTLEALDLGQLKRLRIEHDNKVNCTSFLLNTRIDLVFPHDRLSTLLLNVTDESPHLEPVV